MFKKFVLILTVIAIAFTITASPVSAKHKPVKGKKVKCSYCIDAKHHDCPYWIHNLNRHMTKAEIEEFEWLESHYQDENGEWHVR